MTMATADRLRVGRRRQRFSFAAVTMLLLTTLLSLMVSWTSGFVVQHYYHYHYHPINHRCCGGHYHQSSCILSKIRPMGMDTTLSLDASSSSSSSTSTSNNNNNAQASIIWQHLMDWFQGDFDNYHQVVDDRQQNMEPREGGGHEHFHCTLVPLSDPTTRLAAFYFDANPTRIFRFRHYQLLGLSLMGLGEDADSDQHATATNNGAADSAAADATTTTVEMQLSTLHPELEQELRANSEDPLSWPAIFDAFQPKDDDDDTNASSSKLELLPRCEIAWSLDRDPVQHAYTWDHVPESVSTSSSPSTNDDVNDNDDNGSSSSLHAVMVHGEAIVNSTIVPGMAIRILDQLSLYENVFYINDRGFDPVSGSYIYGNQRGIPYRLCRVGRFHDTTSTATTTTTATLPSAESKNSTSNATTTTPSAQRLQRHVVEDSDLAWTLGPAWRTEDEYQSKMDAIGGISAGINKKSYKSKMTVATAATPSTKEMSTATSSSSSSSSSKCSE